MFKKKTIQGQFLPLECRQTWQTVFLLQRRDCSTYLVLVVGLYVVPDVVFVVDVAAVPGIAVVAAVPGETVVAAAVVAGVVGSCLCPIEERSRMQKRVAEGQEDLILF